MKKKIKKRDIPKKVKIGYADFDIQARHKEWTARTKALGMCHPEKSLIEYARNQNEEEMLNTIIHEILHGIVYHFDIPFRNIKQEEAVIRKMANGLSNVFKDNPDLVRTIYKMYGESDETGRNSGSVE